MSQEPKAQALGHTTVALYHVGGATSILETQQEYEGEQGTVVPAKSIWLNTAHAIKLRDFLNECYPPKPIYAESKLGGWPE